MTPNRLAILIIILIAILVGYIFDFSNELRNFALATAVLGFEVYDFFTSRRRSQSAFTFKIWSTQWMFGGAFAMFLIFSFSDDLMNMWNVFALSETIAYGGLCVVTNRFTTYQVANDGIRNLNNGRVIDFSIITAITINDNAIAIDTTKYQNDLVIKADVLYSPTWPKTSFKHSKVKRNTS
jgi:hypothetical protein